MRDGWVFIIAFAAGVGIPIMAALNGGLGTRLGNPVIAAAVLTLVAFLTVMIILTVTGSFSSSAQWPAPALHYTAGLFASVYFVSITFAAPRIGVGNAIVMVLVGQVICAAIIDHFGLLGVPRAPIDVSRAAGVLFVVVGVFLARRTS